MKPGCPNSKCKFFLTTKLIQKDGYYFRQDDSRKIQRFKFTHCRKKFSNSTHTLEWRQKKRRVNIDLYKVLASGVSLRRSALIINIHRTTVDRKLRYLAQKSRLMHERLLNRIALDKTTHLQFDDLITLEHTKLKPLSVTMAVDAKRRFILGLKVSQIPAFGPLAALSRQRYGKRKSTHKEALYELLEKVSVFVDPEAKIESDEHHLYAQAVKCFFPKATYYQFKGGRGASTGQGELKKLHKDPLFMLNHSCAMLRANINRLVRKTWCTTKDPRRLQDHLDIYMAFHNHVLLKHKLDKLLF
jgi:transposase-like protein